LIDMQLTTSNHGDERRFAKSEPIPEELVDDAKAWREVLLESLYPLSNEMMEMAFEEKEIPVDLIRKTLREGCISRKIQPVLCGSALHGSGVQPVLDGVTYYLPSPLDRPAVEGINPKKKDKTEKRSPDPDEPFCGLVFKILPAKTGDLYWIRAYSGRLKANSRVYNPNRDDKENIAQLWQIHATKKDKQGQVDSITAGDIVCAVGPRNSITGDTLCDTQNPIELPSIQFAQTVLSMAIEPENTTERKKLSEVLDMLQRQDPTLKANENSESGQTLISGMGELHLDVIKHRLTRDFNLNVKFYKPRVSYRETIGKSIEVIGKCQRQIGSQQMFAEVKLRIEPLPNPSSPVVVFDLAAGDATLPDNYRLAAMEELRHRGQGGGMIGSFPLTGMKISLLGGTCSAEGSDEVAFRIAANDGFEKGMESAGPVLLEPVMRLEITTPDDYMGEIVGDLQQRRAMIERTEARGTLTVVTATAPLKELFGYSTAIRSLSQGRAGCSMEPSGYQAAPAGDAEAYSF